MDQRCRDVVSGKHLIAQVFDLDAEGPVIFPTPDFAEMQCGFGEIKTDKDFKAHVHNIVSRNTQHTSEFIYVIKGEMNIIFLDPSGNAVGDAVVKAGEGVLQFIGGHKISMKAGTRYFELKQGPYFGNAKDKTIIES